MSESELNGNVNQKLMQTRSSSIEDISEYTDADESISAPTEILAEFLSSIMMKDYEKALKYCAQILNYEPNNATAKDFYPLIVEKLKLLKNDDYDDSSSDLSDSASLTSTTSSESSDKEGDGKRSSDSDATSASYTSLEDDEASADFNLNGNLLETDFKNGNITRASMSHSSEEENGKKRSKEGKTKLKATPSSLISSSKILIHPTPTVTLKRDNSLFLERKNTYTKSFIGPNQNSMTANISPPLLNLNKNHLKEPSPKTSPRREMPSAGSTTAASRPKKSTPSSRQTKSCRM